MGKNALSVQVPSEYLFCLCSVMHLCTLQRNRFVYFFAFASYIDSKKKFESLKLIL